MPLAMTREEHHVELADAPCDVGIGGRAKRSCQLDLFNILEAGHLIEAAAADYA